MPARTIPLSGRVALLLMMMLPGLALAADRALAQPESVGRPDGPAVDLPGSAGSEEGEPYTAEPGQPGEAAEPAESVEPSEAAADILGGFLDWGVKESFRSYITGNVARGTITADGGASVNADETFRFRMIPGGSYDHESRTVSVAFAGAVHFRGHGYHHPGEGDLLQLSISALRIEVVGDQGVLVADVSSLTLEGNVVDPEPGGEPVIYDDVELAELDFGGVGPVRDGPNGIKFSEVPATLTDDGAPAFGEFYPAGTALDPVSFVIDLAVVPDDVPDPAPPAAPPSATLDKSVVRAGDTLTVTGAGFDAGEQVEVWLLADPGWVATAVADASGAVTQTFVVPIFTSPGSHEVELRGISSGSSLRSPTVEVLAAVQPVALAAAPPSGASLPATGDDDLVLALIGFGSIVVGGALVAIERRGSRASAAGSLRA